MVGILAIVVGLPVYFAFQQDEKNNREHPELVGIDSRTGRKMLDVSKSLWILKGSIACANPEEIEAARKGAPNRCVRAPVDMMVTEMEMNGFLAPVYRVRLLGVGKEVDEVWAPLASLSNDPTPAPPPDPTPPSAAALAWQPADPDQENTTVPFTLAFAKRLRQAHTLQDIQRMAGPKARSPSASKAPCRVPAITGSAARKTATRVSCSPASVQTAASGSASRSPT